MFCSRIAWVCLICLLLCKEDGSSLVSLQLLRGGVWACMRCTCPCLLGLGMGTMLSNVHMCSIMLVLRAVFNMLVRNASTRGPMCFRCMMFNLSGPCELLFFLCFIASWTSVVVSVMLYPCILCVSLLVCCVLCLCSQCASKCSFHRFCLCFCMSEV